MQWCTCGNPFFCRAGDTIQDGVYYWHLSFLCQHCGNALELDGKGVSDVPPEVQTQLLEACGTWELLAAGELPKIRYLLKRLLPETVHTEPPCVYSGTKHQVLWLKEKLLEKGISAPSLEIRPKENNGNHRRLPL